MEHFINYFFLGNIQSMGVNIISKRIRTLILSLAQELRTTFGKMPNLVVVTLGQVVINCFGQVLTIFFCGF